MKTYQGTVSQLIARAAGRPSSYLEDFLSSSVVKNGVVQWTEETHRALSEKYPDHVDMVTGELFEERDENLFRLKSGPADPDQMDVAWMLGSGSNVDNWEIRIGLRSFLRHYKATASLWIIGTIPSWIDRRLIKCIDWPDPYRSNKDANLLGKAIRLAGEPELSNQFILCSDDHILMKDSFPADFRWWHLGEIPGAKSNGSIWNQRLVNTGKQLRAAGLPAFNFEGHVPYPLRKEWCFNALRFSYGNKPGMTVFSTILNANRVTGDHLKSDTVRGWLGGNPSFRTIDHKSQINRFVCLNGDSVKNQECTRYFDEIFRDPAPWELDLYVPPTDH